MRKEISKIVRETLINESFETQEFLNKAKDGIHTAKKNFNDYFNKFKHKFAPKTTNKLSSSVKGNALLSNTEFSSKLEQVASNLGVTSDDLIKVMYKESKIDPKAQNPQTKATGLIQFMPRTAKGLGTTVEELLNMSAVEQLDYVEKYFKPYRSKLNNYIDLYMVTFFPAMLGKSDDWVIQSKNLTPEKVSKQNGVIAKKAGKTPGEPLTVADFKKYANAA